MTTANEYYTQNDPYDAMFISIHLIRNFELAQEDGRTLSLYQHGVLHFGNQQDVHICRDCGDRKGWHWYGGPAEGSDALIWEGNFYIVDEDGEFILCDHCYDEKYPEPEGHDEGPSNPLDTLPAYTLGVMDFIEKLSGRF